MTKGYRRLQEVTRNTKYYKDVILQAVKKGYIRLQGITKATINKRGFKQLQRVTRDYRGLALLTKC